MVGYGIGSHSFFGIRVLDNSGYGVPTVGSLHPLRYLVYFLDFDVLDFDVRDFGGDPMLFFLSCLLTRDYFGTDRGVVMGSDCPPLLIFVMII